MNEPTELDLAQLKFEMRQMYNSIGRLAAHQVVYEMLLGANVLMEVIIEEGAPKQ